MAACVTVTDMSKEGIFLGWNSRRLDDFWDFICVLLERDGILGESETE